MRLIGTVETTTQAENFVSYLYAQGIECLAELDDTDASTKHEIWVRDEDQLPRAKDELQQFKTDSEALKYTQATAEAEQIRRERRKHAAKIAGLKRSMPKQNLPLTPGTTQPLGSITLVLIMAAIVVSLATDFGRGSTQEYQRAIFKSRNPEDIKPPLASRIMFVDLGAYLTSGQDPLASIKRGEVWRLFTPALLHLSWSHAIFNIMAMFTLGSMCETLLGRGNYIGLVVASHLVGALMQGLMPIAWQGSPFFGGLSGIVYGIFGYLWIRPFVHRSLPQLLTSMGIGIMLVWCFLGFMPFFPEKMANWAHLGGLITGALAAFVLPWRRSSS